nr:protein nessun dorma [Leptinotarsa decemlineata]
MDEIISFDKSLSQRLQEFTDALSAYNTVPASELGKQWGFFIEVTVDKIGWQAIWKIPRVACESLHIHFPSVVLVFVLDVDVKEHKALIRVLAVQDDICIPEKHWVPLIQLWPTRGQDKTIALSLMQTAEALDMLRFFYLYLYMPWDRDEDDSLDWKDKHLESRLKFHYDLKNGTIPRSVAEHIHGLLTDARRLQTKREILETRLANEDRIGEFEKDITDNKITRSLTEIHIRLLEIQSQIEILENPILREVYIRRQSEVDPVDTKGKPQVWLVFNEGTAQEHISFLQQVANCYPTESLKFSTSLAKMLETTNSGDVYLLNESVHNIRTTGALEKGGVLHGIGSNKKIILTSTIEDVMLDFKEDTVVLENLTIDTRAAQCGILVRKGRCVLKNCRILGDGKSSTYQGIIVLSGAQLELQSCEISGYSTGIVGNSGSRIDLRNCDVHHMDYGMKVFDDCIIELENTIIRECMETGFTLETVKSEVSVGDFDTLKLISGVKYADVTGTNNAKGDVMILKKQQLKPVEDLFANPDLDPTIIESDSDEDTLLEN